MEKTPSRVGGHLMPPKEDLKHKIARRAVHACWALTIGYYLFPPTIFGLPKWVVPIIMVTIPTLILEAWRMRYKKIFFGFREHERHHIASYFWLTNGTVVLLLLFPQYIAAPCIVATTLADPVIGETRMFRRRIAFPIGILTCMAVFVIFRYPLILAALAAIAAFLAESLTVQVSWGFREEMFYSRSRHKISRRKRLFDFFLSADDDFMMQVNPAIVIYVLALFFTAQGWGWLLPPGDMLNPLPELNWLA